MAIKILVIEDAEALRKDIMETLIYHDYEVKGASDGVEGVKLAREFHPDLIICDIMMPQMDGYQVLAELRPDGAGITIPFIFLTAKADKSEMRFGMDAGADDYLTKPFTVEELISSVTRRLELYQKRNDYSDAKLDELRENIILALPHELRTPLTGIIGFADILIMDSETLEPDKTAEMARYIHAAAQRLYRLTENYVIYAQLEVLRTDPKRIELLRQFTTANPQSIIEDCIYEKAQYYHREADINMSISDEAVISIMDDNLKKVVEELVDNAFKFSSVGSAVDITGVMDKDFYVLTVLDRGRGMSQEEVKRLGAFMQFGRQVFEQQGSGLGLAIVNRSVDLHGGKMLVESDLSDFTKVTVKLPAVPTLESHLDAVAF
ncbi:MAG: response regulator [Anaerolineae bacterium]